MTNSRPTVSIAIPSDCRRQKGTTPTELNVYQTSACNLKCSFCSLTAGKTETAPDVTPTLIEQVLAKYPSIVAACIAGFGEPLTSRHLFDVIKTLKRHGIYVGLITNGILVPKLIDKIQEAAPQHVSVSLNACDEGEYIALVEAKPWDFQKAQEGVRLLVDSGIRTFVSFVASRRNYHRIPGYIALGNCLGADQITIVNILPNAGDVHEGNPNFNALVITDEDKEVLAAIEGYKAHCPGADRVSVWPRPISRKLCPSQCSSPFVGIGVDGRGMVSGCRRVVGPHAAHGHLDAGYQSDYFKSERSGLLGETPIRDECLMCFGNWDTL